MRGEPPIAAVNRRELLQEAEQHPLLPGARPELPIRPLVKAVVPSTSTSRGQASRCANTAVSAASLSPRTNRSK